MHSIFNKFVLLSFRSCPHSFFCMLGAGRSCRSLQHPTSTRSVVLASVPALASANPEADQWPTNKLAMERWPKFTRISSRVIWTMSHQRVNWPVLKAGNERMCRKRGPDEALGTESSWQGQQPWERVGERKTISWSSLLPMVFHHFLAESFDSKEPTKTSSFWKVNHIQYSERPQRNEPRIRPSSEQEKQPACLKAPWWYAGAVSTA